MSSSSSLSSGVGIRCSSDDDDASAFCFFDAPVEDRGVATRFGSLPVFRDDMVDMCRCRFGGVLLPKAVVQLCYGGNLSSLGNKGFRLLRKASSIMGNNVLLSKLKVRL